MAIQFFQRISVRLARISVLVAFTLGVLVSLFQVYIDYTQQSTLVSQKVSEIFAVTKDTAQRAAYQLDPDLANEVLLGIANINYLKSVSLIDDKSSVIAHIDLDIPPSNTQAITNLMTPKTARYEQRLESHTGEYQGSLILDVDLDAALASFYDRAASVFVSGVLRNFVLSIILLLFFHYSLTRPFTRLAEKFQNIDSNHLDNGGSHQHLEHDQNHKSDEIGYIVDSANELIAEIVTLNTNLEKKVESRTQELQHRSAELEHSNNSLNSALVELKSSQQQLIEKEKMASLGKLVAGVAHEVNTPLGISVTAASFLGDATHTLNDRFSREELSAEDLQAYLEQAQESIELLESNLKRSANLIQNFKKVAVNQSTEHFEQIDLNHYIEDIIKSLKPETDKHQHRIHISKNSMNVRCNTSAIAQVMTNLVFNSIIHGFEFIEQGNIHIESSIEGDDIVIRYKDDGKGISEDNLPLLFEPFFTTKRNNGGTGLGTHIVYNIVTQVLGGDIQVSSRINQGLSFYIRFPHLKDADTE